MSDGNDAKRRDRVLHAEDFLYALDERRVWVDCRPYGPQINGFCGEQHILRGGRAILNPEGLAGGGATFGGVCTDDNGAARLMQHFCVGEDVGECVHGGFVIDGHEFPGLLVHRRWGGHRRFEQNQELFASHRLRRVLTDAGTTGNGL